MKLSLKKIAGLEGGYRRISQKRFVGKQERHFPTILRVKELHYFQKIF